MQPLSVVTLCIAALGVLPFPFTAAADQAPRRPNIVLIVADDLGWNGVGYHGGFVQTPHIDRIARGGVELDRFYVSPMCSPTRAGLLTGRYPMRFGMARSVVRPWARYGLPPEERTLPEALADAGYAQRAALGKWHLGHLEPRWHPLAQGFTEFRGCYNGAGDYFTRDRDGQPDWHANGDDIQEDGYTTDLIADAAAGFVRKQAGTGQPFFCYVAFTAPHEPLEAPKPWLDRYAALDDDPADGRPSKKQSVAAMTACMDEGIGRILKAVEDAGIGRDTIVWFMSDNGGIGGIPGNNAPLRGAKLTTYEGGVRVPAAVWWPGTIEGGRKVTTPLLNTDVMPTLLAIAGAKVAAAAVETARPLDGQDVSGLLRNPIASDAIKPRDLYFFTGQSGLENEQIAITTADDWKLIVIGPDVRRPAGAESQQHRVELYHLRDDPLEQKDLAAAQPERVKALALKLREFRKSEPAESLPPMNRKPPKFEPPPKWHNAPAAPTR
jgi:arylsulfatase B